MTLFSTTVKFSACMILCNQCKIQLSVDYFCSKQQQSYFIGTGCPLSWMQQPTFIFLFYFGRVSSTPPSKAIEANKWASISSCLYQVILIFLNSPRYWMSFSILGKLLVFWKSYLHFGQVTCILDKLLAFWTSYLHFGQVTSVLVLL